MANRTRGLQAVRHLRFLDERAHELHSRGFCRSCNYLDAVLELYQQGYSANDLARAFTLTKSAVSRHLRLQGITLRPYGRGKRKRLVV